MTTTQLMLEGQAAAPDGPVDLSAMFLMHHAFRRDLRAFAAAVPVTPVGDLATWRLLRNRWALFGTILHHHHHTIEDDHIWPLLMARADAAGRDTLAAMEAEHEEIDPLLAACRQGFDALAAGATEDVRAALEIRVVAAGERLGRHLAHEEGDALTLVQAHMSAAEWDAIDNDHAKKAFSFRETLQALPWVMTGLPAGGRNRLLAHGGAPLRIMWAATRGSFERRERATFRYAAARVSQS
jgi:hypothetical protein